MSRGLGWVEREVLAVFEGAGELLSAREVASRVFDHPIPVAVEHGSVCRALASLAKKGLADSNGRAWGSPQAVQKLRKKKLRLQSSHSKEERGLDAYFTPPVAVHSLICKERQYLPQSIWEPAAGAGAIVNVLRGAGYAVTASDIADYGLEGCEMLDYLAAPPPPGIEAIVTNPPYGKAEAFVRKALSEVGYVALLLRTNFLEGAKRDSLFDDYPYARMWQASLRLPMMHREGWTGKRAGSNTAHAWFVWDRNANQKNINGRFNYKKLDFDWRKVTDEAQADANV